MYENKLVGQIRYNILKKFKVKKGKIANIQRDFFLFTCIKNFKSTKNIYI